MSIDNSVTLKVKLKVSDVLRYNMYVAYRSKFSKILLLVGTVLLGYIFYKYFMTTDTIGVFLSRNIVLICVSVFILIGTPFKVWKITALQMQSPIFSGASKYVFYPDKIYMEVGEVNDEVPWETYAHIVETNKDFRFFVDTVQAQIIPKHGMEDTQVTKLREVIKIANPEDIYELKG
ncbi:MAG: hypothetical protein ATN34_03485 [Epulopiscium sp. Nele67-Bin002]|nr:MAG: hypothetical protein BEN18_04740 [Epulopiscium sp. Nuni2H_MBin001]OON91683.1 MAG: hypothetical protein ATN34_03485 [Epulopiscium sp. Nele67-Bin002]OON93730.1 MAG: hypothetical protein ATN33_05385 [Epulopiscium sp. Nele67-Bin001]